MREQQKGGEKMKQTEKTEKTASPIFAGEAEFRRKLRAYVKYCNTKDAERLPNVAGFCRFCKIRRSDFAALREAYPLCYDLAQSTFMDEALNKKAPNASATMAFLLERVCAVDEDEDGTVKILCAHDPMADGA